MTVSVLHCPTKSSFLVANKRSNVFLVANATMHLFHELINLLVHFTYKRGHRFHIQTSHSKKQDSGTKSTQKLFKNVETLTCLRLFGFSQRRTGDLSPTVEKGFGSSTILTQLGFTQLGMSCISPEKELWYRDVLGLKLLAPCWAWPLSYSEFLVFFSIFL